jgi:hypothetical protein
VHSRSVALRMFRIHLGLSDDAWRCRLHDHGFDRYVVFDIDHSDRSFDWANGRAAGGRAKRGVGHRHRSRGSGVVVHARTGV